MNRFFLYKKRLRFSQKIFIKKRQNRRRYLDGCPQKRAICRRVYWVSPKKPNSARRKVARTVFSSSRLAATSYIPGETHNLQQFSVVLVRGGRVQDLPGVNYKVVRGVWDCKGLAFRTHGRSRFGAKWNYALRYRVNRFLRLSRSSPRIKK